MSIESKVWFIVNGVGYKGFSGGLLHLITGSANRFCYWRIYCQGTSTCTFGTTDFFTVKNQIEKKNEGLSDYIMQSVVVLDIADTFSVSGTVLASLEVIDQLQDTERMDFKSERNVDVKGFSTGDVKIRTRVTEPDRVMSSEGAKELKNDLWTRTMPPQFW